MRNEARRSANLARLEVINKVTTFKAVGWKREVFVPRGDPPQKGRAGSGRYGGR